MRLLLDTHVFLWWLAGGRDLTHTVCEALASAANTLLLSVASAWEMHIKQAKGRLTVPEDLETVLWEEGIHLLGITLAHARAAAGLPPHHRDPFDRMLLAQAQREGLMIVTHDALFRPYGVPILWT